jgi:DNA-binding response OmpR family regulator
MAKILICDDEPGLRAVIKRYAQLDGHEATEAGNGIEAIEACKKEQFDIIIMDIMMPKLDGFSAVKEIRKTSDVPIIMLSARGEEYDKVSGFEYGVDDYVVKPFSSKEIMLRITAILRRKTAAAPAPDKDDDGHAVFAKDGFSVDMTAYKMFIDGKQVELAPKLYDLLFFLIRNRGVAVSREKILTSVWGYKNIDDVRTLDTHIKLLRKAMGPYAGLVTTLRTHGYRFEG